MEEHGGCFVLNCFWGGTFGGMLQGKKCIWSDWEVNRIGVHGMKLTKNE